MNLQAADSLMMVEPTTFAFNKETASSNFFQQPKQDHSADYLKKKSCDEFFAVSDKLKSIGVHVYIKKHPSNIHLPDAVFPNNWVSFLPGGTVVIYPMMATNRRMEKNYDIIIETASDSGFSVKKTIDLSYFEKQEKFLEGTGSVVFDHVNRMAYASQSPRTNKEVLEFLCHEIDYDFLLFHAFDNMNRAVYHTNVMLAITNKIAIICLESIPDRKEREILQGKFKISGHEIFNITLTQMESFAGNMLEVRNNKEASYLLLSQSAFDSLEPEQVSTLEKHHQLIPLPVFTIETTGGGSVRCMLAEIFTCR